MDKKIAFVSVWYNHILNTDITLTNLFYIECLFKSAKKNFLPNQNVEFIFITNSITKIDNVINIKDDYVPSGFYETCLMKILSLKFIDTKYDYVYVSDVDQIITNKINEDFLNDKMIVVDHFYSPNIYGIHKDITRSNNIPLNFDTKKYNWIMGNFFGGSSEIMKKLYDFTIYQHNINLNLPKLDGLSFYMQYPDEFYLVKFIYENDIPHKRLKTAIIPDVDGCFLSDFNENEELYPNNVKAKILHNTKKNKPLLEKIIKFFI